jgi:sigma-B regulation protein RsbU (phosphoserine phosphatase)
MFVTLFYGILDGRTRELVYSNGGHNPPMLVRPGQPVRPLPLTGDTMVGIMDDSEFHTKRQTLAADEALVLYTDGVTEAMDPAGNQFTDERLMATLAPLGGAPPRQIVESIVAAVKAFAGSAPQSDDLTTLVIRCPG